MLKHVILLLFLYGIKYGGSSSTDQSTEPKDITKTGIKKNELGANDSKSEDVIRNFRNPVLEYLLHKNSERTMGPPKSGMIREIRHSQTLLVPNYPGGPFLRPLPVNFLDQVSGFHIKEMEEGNDNQDPVDAFLNYLNNKSEKKGIKTGENGNTVTSPMLHLNNKNQKQLKDEFTRVQIYPATAVFINTYGKDGTLKNSVTHFQPDFNSAKAAGKEATYVGSADKNYKNIQNAQYTVSKFAENTQNTFPSEQQHQMNYLRQEGQSWPLAKNFQTVVNNPSLYTYNTYPMSMYNAVSTMIEYGPDRSPCSNNTHQTKEIPEKTEKKKLDIERIKEKIAERYQRREAGLEEPNFFDEITLKSDIIKRSKSTRRRRDTTSVFLKTRGGDKIDVTLEEPVTEERRQKNSGRSDLVLRKGGIAIAGPWGAATAYTGGTAIVGPYGTVYKSPEGQAILGPYAKVINITDDTSFEEILRMHREMESKNQQQRPPQPQYQRQPVVSTQPHITGLKNYKNYFSYRTDLPVKIDLKPAARNYNRYRPKVLRLKDRDITKTIEDIRQGEFRRVVEDTPYDERELKKNETTLIFRPKSKAEAGRNGVALSAPVSHAILFPGQKANIFFEPESVASAGPSGFAHAHSDLFVSYIRSNTTKIDPEDPGRSIKEILSGTYYRK